MKPGYAESGNGFVITLKCPTCVVSCALSDCDAWFLQVTWTCNVTCHVITLSEAGVCRVTLPCCALSLPAQDKLR
jgi:hypothetical protein